MIVDIDLSSGSVALVEPGVFTAFHAAVREGSAEATTADVVALLGDDGAPLDDGHVMVAVDAVRRWAGLPGGEWEDDFAGMLGYASSKGWMTDDGSMIRAHVVWEGR